MRFWKPAPTEYRKLVAGLLFFSLFNSADVFLLLKTKEITGSDQLTIGAYILYNLVFALAAYPLGRLADHWGIRRIFLGGLALFVIVYFLFGLSGSTTFIVGAFILYGLYAAATEGIAKAWITNLAHDKDTGTAIGFYTSCESICVLIASIIAGALWTVFGSTVTFLTTACAALLSLVYFMIVFRSKPHNTETK